MKPISICAFVVCLSFGLVLNASAQKMSIDGQAGIGVSSPTEKLEVNGKIKVSESTNNSIVTYTSSNPELRFNMGSYYGRLLFNGVYCWNNLVWQSQDWATANATQPSLLYIRGTKGSLNLFSNDGNSTNGDGYYEGFISEEADGRMIIKNYPIKETAGYNDNYKNYILIQSPTNLVHVVGGIDISPPRNPVTNALIPTVEPTCGIYYCTTDTLGLWVKHADGTKNRITSHADPREVKKDAISSFGDKSVAMPFSFQHENNVLGKGEIVDLAKAMAWIEKKMQAEMGADAGQLRYEYEIPEKVKMSVAEWEEDLVNRTSEQVASSIKDMPWIKVAGVSGTIPADSVELYDEMKQVEITEAVDVAVLDYDSMTIKTEKHDQVVQKNVPTGRKLKRLKDGWELREDGLYRRPTLDDVKLDSLIGDPMTLPKWIQERAQGQVVSYDANALKARISERVTAMLVEDAGKALAQKTGATQVIASASGSLAQ